MNQIAPGLAKHVKDLAVETILLRSAKCLSNYFIPIQMEPKSERLHRNFHDKLVSGNPIMFVVGSTGMLSVKSVGILMLDNQLKKTVHLLDDSDADVVSDMARAHRHKHSYATVDDY